MSEATKMLGLSILDNLEEYIKLIEPYKNEQWVLDYMDRLNKLSIKY